MTQSERDRVRLAEERYWPKVDKSDGCWNWTAYKTQDGYGQFYLDGKMVRATHFALLTEGCDVPNGMCICHTCDNPSCVNPDHIFLGTVLENNHDRDRKGRGHKLSKERARHMQALAVTARKANGNY